MPQKRGSQQARGIIRKTIPVNAEYREACKNLLSLLPKKPPKIDYNSLLKKGKRYLIDKCGADEKTATKIVKDHLGITRQAVADTMAWRRLLKREVETGH